MRPLVLLALCASTASADPLDHGERYLTLEPVRVVELQFIDDQQKGKEPPPWRDTSPLVRGAAYAQLAAGSQHHAVAGVAAAVSGFNCPLLEGSAQVRIDSSEIAPAAGVATGRICPMRTFVAFDLDGTVGRGLAPSFAERRDHWRRAYDTRTYRVAAGFGELYNAHHRNALHHSMMWFGFSERIDLQRDEMMETRMRQVELFGTLYRLRRMSPDTRLQIDLLSLTNRASKGGLDDKGSIVNQIEVARVEVETPRIGVTARGGWVASGKHITIDGELFDSSGLPKIREPTGELALRLRSARTEMRVRAARDVFGTIDGNLARELRFDARLHLVIKPGARPLAANLAPFVTRTRTWTQGFGERLDHGYGAVFDVGRDVAPLLRLEVLGELGVSPYAAQLTPTTDPTPQFGAQLQLALSARIGR